MAAPKHVMSAPPTASTTLSRGVLHGTSISSECVVHDWSTQGPTEVFSGVGSQLASRKRALSLDGCFPNSNTAIRTYIHREAGQLPHCRSPATIGYTEDYAAFNALETESLTRPNSNVFPDTVPLRYNLAEEASLASSASDYAVHQPDVERPAHTQSNDGCCPRSYNDGGQPLDSAEAAADDSFSSYSDRMDDMAVPADDSREISLKDIGPAAQYFHVGHNTSSAFTIKLRDTAMASWDNARPWPLLESLDSVQWNGIAYRRGDIIYVRTGAKESAVDILEVADIRCLGDSRSVFRGFWYYHRSEMSKNLGKTGLRMWPRNYLYCKTTHTDIVMWDCATGHLPKGDRVLIVPGIICDMSEDSWQITRSERYL